MKTSELAAAASTLSRTLHKLNEQWLDAGDAWTDDASRSFSKQYLEPLPEQFRLALAAINHLAEIAHEAERDCADPDREW